MIVRAWLSALALAASIATPCLAASTPPGLQPSSAFEKEIAGAKAAMLTEPQTAYDRAQRALALAAKEPASQGRDVETATANWLSAEALVRLKHPEQALPVLDRALAVVTKALPNSKLEGDVLKSQGRAAAATGRVQAALEDFQRAFSIYEKAKQPRGQAMALQEIGSIYSAARDYPHVLQYNAQSQDIFSQDPALTLTANNNRGFALKDLGRLPEAEAEFRKALAAAEQMQSGYLQAHILTNIASAELLEGKKAAAKADVMRGLALAAKDPEARSEKPFLLGMLAKIADDAGDDVTAAHLLDEVFAGVDLETTPMDYRDFHEIAARVYERTGDGGKALEHLKAFKRLDDEGRALAASTNAALMAAKFDFANQTAKIAQLKVTQAQAKANFTTVITIILLVGVFLVTGLITNAFLTMRRSRNRIRAVNHDLEASNSALEKALKAKTEFLATTSHEIRTPLNGILGMTQVMLADRSIKGPTRERLTLVQSAGETMNALVSDLLDVAKIETGHLSVDRAEVDLKRLLEDAAKVWTDQARTKGLAFKLDLADCPERIVEDADRLRQVVFNLMSNAAKFTERGWVSLSARAVAGDGTGERLHIAIGDSGIGIPEDQLDRIFESFTQVDGSKSRQYGGTGLGLTICRNLVDALGGKIVAESRLGHGSTFTIDLPLVRGAAIEPEVASAGLGGSSLLILDDNPLAQAMLRAVLQGKVRHLQFVGTVEAALEAMAATAFDRLLVDGGCLQRQNPGDPIAPVGRLTGLASTPVSALWPASGEADLARLASLGVEQVIAKPIAPAALLARLEEASASPARSDASSLSSAA